MADGQEVLNLSSEPPSDSSINYDFLSYLTNKYGYEKFKMGLEIVRKNNMIRFSEDGEQKIKNELWLIIEAGDDVNAFYSDWSSYIIMTASMGKLL